MENELLMPQVRLSRKEVSGLAARVLGTALMPWGAIGGAAQAIEFAELAGGERLRRLAGQMDEFDATMWRTPEIVIERDTYALCDAAGGSALFHAAALADWLDAWLGEQDSVAVGLRNVVHADDLHAISCWLARRGHAALVLTVAAQDDVMEDAGRAVLSAASAGHDKDWTHARWTRVDTMPGELLSFASRLTCDMPVVGAWQALPQICARWMSGDRQVETGQLLDAPRNATPDAMQDALPKTGASAVIVAMKSPVFMDLTGRPPARCLDAEHFNALQVKAAAHGWPLPRAQWEQLMRFADRSLIHTSERSREGAG